MSLEITVFGRTRVLVDGAEQDLGGRRPAEVLALLVAGGGEVVDADVLATRLWRGSPPGAARTTVQGYVAGLRRILEPGVAARDASVLVTRRNGYALSVGTDQVDLWRFLDRVRRAEAARDRGEAADAVELYAEALATWGASPLQDVADVLDVGPVVVAAQERHLAAVESCAELHLARGEGDRMVADLAAAAARNPLRERLQTLLARALYTAGRQADALDVLRETRLHLADDLGLDPSKELRDLEAAILRQDESMGRDFPAPPGVPHSPAPHIAATPPRARTREPTPSTPLVGRDLELRAVEEALSLAASGGGTAVVVSGEPGIGKTALVRQFLAQSGAPFRWGRCLETSGVPPHWVWQQVLDGPPPIAGADAGARFAVGLEVVRRLHELATDGPVVVVLDDLQWADSDSLHTLEVVLGELGRMPVLLVVTVRAESLTDASLTQVLAHAARIAGSAHLVLPGLGTDDVATLVGRLTGRTPSGEEADRLRVRSGGNPFLLSELAALAPDGETVPAGVHQVLRQRLAALSPDAQAVTGALAVAGRDLSPGLLAQVLGRRLEQLSAPVDEGLAHGLLRETPTGIGLVHDLVRQVAHGALGLTRRARIHDALAEALCGPAASASSAAIAFHRSEAAAGAVDRRAAEACLVAAREALELAGDAEAREFATRGLGHAPAAATDLVGDLHHVRGVALRRLGLLEDAVAALETAAHLARADGDGPRLARAALGAAADGASGYWGSMGALYSPEGGLLVEALEEAGAPGPVRSAAMSALAVHRACHGRDATDLAAQAVSCAGEDPEARARSLVAQYVVRWSPDQADHRLRLARALLEVAVEAPVFEATGLHLLRCALHERGRPEESAAVSRRFSELVERRGDGDQLLLDLWWHTGMALARGDYAQARWFGDRAVDTAPTASPAAAAVTRTSRLAIEGIIAWHEHRLADVVPEVVDLATNFDPDWLMVLAQAHAQAGRREPAHEAIARLHEHPAAGTRSVVRTVLLADVYLELGDVERTAQLLPELERYGDSMVLFWPGMTPLGPAALYRGGALALLGLPGAREQLTRAVQLSEAFGFTPFAERGRRMLQELGTATVQTS